MAKDREPVNFEGYESESTEEEEEDEGSEDDASSDSDSGPVQTKKPSSLPTTGKFQPQAASRIQEEQMKESESDTETSSDSDCGPGQSKIAVKPSPFPTAAMAKTQSQAAARIQEEQMKEQSETETDSASESDSDEPAPNTSGPVEGPKTSSGGVVKPTPKTDSVTSARAYGVKRPAEEKDIEAKDLKKSKIKPELETSVAKRSNDDSKKQLFQRLWSQDDEIVILKGMIDYAERTNSDPVTDLNAFHNFIRDNLHVDVTRSQLQDKIRRLKRKYGNNKGKEKEGKDRIFSKPHEKKAYELSKQIWGRDNGKESSSKVNGSMGRRRQRANATENGEFEDSTIARIVNGALDMARSLSVMKSNDTNMDEKVYRIGSELFEGKDGVEGAREWRRLAVQEIEIHLKTLEIKRAQVKLVLDALTSSN